MPKFELIGGFNAFFNIVIFKPNRIGINIIFSLIRLYLFNPYRCKIVVSKKDFALSK
jgi:hypothetical protein